MLISPFTPLFFTPRRSDGIPSRYVQTFSRTDRILIEVFTRLDEEQFDITLRNLCSGREFTLECSRWIFAAPRVLLFTELQGLENGIYTVRVAGNECSPFRVTSDAAELAQTTLIQYTMKDNKQRDDAVFFIDGMRYFFDFRVPGGFKDSGWSFSVDSESFTTPDADPVQMFGMDSVQKKFTMGWQEGVPVVFGELLNRLLTCHYVYFDGVRYARKDASAPEMSAAMDGLDSFIFTQQLQQVRNLDPEIEDANRAVMLRPASGLYRSTSLDNDTTINRIID